jgi:uncharacterized membrane protein
MDSKAGTIGMFLALAGGIMAVLCGVFVAQSAEPLFALLIIGFALNRVKNSSSVKNPSRPVLMGGLISILSLVVGAVVLYLNNAGVLWSLILVMFIVDIVDDK